MFETYLAAVALVRHVKALEVIPFAISALLIEHIPAAPVGHADTLIAFPYPIGAK